MAHINKVNGTGKKVNIEEAVNQAIELPLQVMTKTLNSEIMPHLSEEKRANLMDYISQYQSMLEMSLVLVGINLALSNRKQINLIKDSIRLQMRQMEDALKDQDPDLEIDDSIN